MELNLNVTKCLHKNVNTKIIATKYLQYLKMSTFPLNVKLSNNNFVNKCKNLEASLFKKIKNIYYFLNM